MNFGMELHAVELGRRMGDGSKPGVSRARQAYEFGGHLIGRVSMAHPDRQFVAQTREDSIGHFELNLRRSILAMIRFLHPASEVLRHELHAVANAQNGKSQLPDASIRSRRIRRINTRRPARENQTGR